MRHDNHIFITSSRDEKKSRSNAFQPEEFILNSHNDFENGFVMNRKDNHKTK